MDTTQSSLLEAVKRYLTASGDASAGELACELEEWRRFYAIYNNILTRFTAKQGLRGDETEDLIQDVWIEVISRLPNFSYDPTKGGFRRWLYTIVHSRATDSTRRRVIRERLGRQLTELDPFDRLSWALIADQKDDLDTLFRVEVARTALENLRLSATSMEWHVFEACKIRDLTSAAVAEELSVSPESVRKALQRAQFKLRTALADLLGTADCGHED